jgi:hypothetical protein
MARKPANAWWNSPQSTVTANRHVLTNEDMGYAYRHSAASPI